MDGAEQLQATLPKWHGTFQLLINAHQNIVSQDIQKLFPSTLLIQSLINSPSSVIHIFNSRGGGSRYSIHIQS